MSLGETRASTALIQALRHQQPGLRLILTHGTATGREAGRALLREGDLQCWLPYDTPGATRRFMQHLQPAVAVLMETEIWPNLLRACEQQGVPAVLANARLSEKSARQGRRLAPLLHAAGARLRLALAQTEEDARRIRAARVPEVRVSGNLKYDVQPDETQLQRGKAWRAAAGRPVLAAVNTRDGEEAELLSQWLLQPEPRPQLLVVPRHPQRFDEVAALIEAAGLPVSRRSTWGDDGPDRSAAPGTVWLGDSLGEMGLYYGLADLAVLGGSFQPMGGHNLIESAACGCPIILGPSTFNFAEAAELALSAGAAWRTANLAAALTLARSLVAAPQRLAMASGNALRFSAEHRGAAQRMAEAILALLPPASTRA